MFFVCNNRHRLQIDNSGVSKNSFYNTKALGYFNPQSLKNAGILRNAINPYYMQLGNSGIFDFIPKGVY
jgi:hypothetical protein